MKGKHRIRSCFAMALILVLMALSFINYIYGFLEEREGAEAVFDLSEPEHGSVKLLGTEALEQAKQPEIGYEKQQIDLIIPSDFEEIPCLQASFRWGWELFDRNSTERSEELTVAAASLIQIEYYLGYGKTIDDIRALREDLGFEQTEVFNNGVSMNVDRPVTIISSVKAPFPGKDGYIICVDIRGTYSAGDAVTDLKAAYNGFAAAAEDVCESITQYAKTYCGDAARENITLFVFGHSLGGACAGLQAELLDKAGFAPERTFAYTFASPKYRLNGGRNAYPNVMNFVVSKDFVPLVPLLDGRYGEDFRYDDPFPELYVGDALAIMLSAQPRNDLADILWRHHNSTNYLIEVGERNYSADPPWSDALYYGARLLLQTMQIAAE